MKRQVRLLLLFLLVEVVASTIIMPAVGIPFEDAIGMLLLLDVVGFFVGLIVYLMIHNPGADRRAGM